MTDHLVIFAKSPRLGVAKRRLGRQIGMVPAWRFSIAMRSPVCLFVLGMIHDGGPGFI
jgi:hypothetical protein